MKNNKQKLFLLAVISCLSISYFNLAVADQTHSQRKKNQTDFEDYGQSLSLRAKGSIGLNASDERKIKELGGKRQNNKSTKTPHFPMVDKGAVSILGIGYQNKAGNSGKYDKTRPKLVLLESLSGAPVPRCSDPLCGIGAITRGNPHEALMLENSITASKSPIKQTRIINGVEKEVTFFVVVEAVYEGSYCNTTYSGGSGYQTCYSRRR
ncbi:MAG: hypothetical protein ABGX51_03670 [Gammaproteobacteria bacterium]